MLKRTTVLLAIMALLVFAGAALAQDATATPLPVPEAGVITQRIIERGSLICGVNQTLPGFGFPNESGEFQGFDVDTCRAVAAAILGDANAVTYRPITASERQPALASGEVDMISRNTTFTLSRDTLWGATFAPVTFYDGQGIMVMADAGIASLEDLAGGTICTNAGTTTEQNITDAMAALGLDFELQTFQDFDGVMASFFEGRCDAVTSDVSGLLSRKAVSPDPGALAILDFVISKEPLGPLTPQGDTQFADIVRWTIFGLIQAEEFGITSENIDSFMASENPNIQRFLGTNGNTLGSTLNLSDDFMVQVISQVGNYGEIFDRNLGPDTIFGLSRGINALWTDGGLMYSPPFR
ncbi:MAG TPA: amino acid ABC transporter substrate-binding protein [Candidatus Limnocylindrales bacterium]|nr:amino acid ABC transporter substrate-binding protein [Candidatus Limnocylindrales bacterium]